MIFQSYLEKQLGRYEQGMTSDAVYRMASHIEGQYQVLPVNRLAQYDQGCDFTTEEKVKVVQFCQELVATFA